MKFNKLLIISMLVMMICCVSAVSATDINATDDITVDEVSEVIEEVEIDDVSDGVVEEQNLVTASADTGKVNGVDYSNYFDTTSGALTNTAATTLTFTGNFNEKTFQNFVINRAVTINANGATFNNLGFDLTSSGITLNGATIIMDAPNGSNCYAIDIENANNVTVSGNKITYTCTHDNADKYNYAIKAKNSENLKISDNEISATVPLKQPNWAAVNSIDSDYVAGVAIESCNNLRFTGNNLTVIGNKRVGGFPTLDAFIIAQSEDAYIGQNKIIENDIITDVNSYSYIYGIDVYHCERIHIDNNTVIMNGNESNVRIGGNGTGAAYCVQLTGPHEGVVISNNKLTTANNGPNLGIYSQNYYDATQLTIYGNNITVTGKAGSDPWSLVSGMELQDTNATVYGNNIIVNNTEPYTSGDYAFGISYCQPTDGEHYYYIYENNVTVYNGEYTIYLIQSDYPDSYISNNYNLIAYVNNTSKTDNDTIYAPDLGYYGI